MIRKVFYVIAFTCIAYTALDLAEDKLIYSRVTTKLSTLYQYRMLEDYIGLSSTLNSVKKNKYTRQYRCTNFAVDTIKGLRDRGLYASFVVGNDGTSNARANHAWIAVYFDPQTGRMVKTKDNYRIVDLCDLKRGDLIQCFNGAVNFNGEYLRIK